MNRLTSVTSGPSSFNPLKRTLPVEASCDIPRLPKLALDLLLQVYTHHSLRRSTCSPEEYGDNERLAELGRTVLDTVVTHALFNRRPVLGLSAMCSQRDKVLSNTNIARWAEMYNMCSRLRCLPELRATLDPSQESRSLFCAYVGGVYAGYGIKPVQRWINELLQHSATNLSPRHPEHESMEQWHSPNSAKRRQVDVASSSPLSGSPHVSHASRPSTPPSSSSHASTPSRQMSSEPSGHESSENTGRPPSEESHGHHDSHYKTTPALFASQPPASPPRPPSSMPALYQSSPVDAALHPQSVQDIQPRAPVFYGQQPLALSPAPPNSPSVVPKQEEVEVSLHFEHLLHQICVERRFLVSYAESYEGTAYDGRWSVRCIVDGVQLGTGSATTRLFAKDVAAREAYYAIGGQYEDSVRTRPQQQRSHRVRARKRKLIRSGAAGDSSVYPGHHAADGYHVQLYPTE